MEKNKKKIKSERKKRYFGTVKVPRNAKFCWMSKHDKNGWSLGFALGKRTVWLTGLRFANRDEIERAMSSNMVFVHLKNDPPLE